MSELIDDLLFLVCAPLAIFVLISVTVMAIGSVRRGENPWHAFKKWLGEVIDVLFSLG